jgi:hypothetical protein
MRTLSMIGLVVVSAAGCATTAQSPEDQCAFFARNEGFQWVGNLKSAPEAGGTAVSMQLKDEFARPFTATCLYANGKTTWLGQLPRGVARDPTGRNVR